MRNPQPARSGVQCLSCKDIIVSLHRHDFRVCSCGHTFVDGGSDYLRYGTMNKGPEPKVVNARRKGGR